MPQMPPVAMQTEVRREPAWHIADGSALQRKEPSYDIPPGCTRIVVPAFALPAAEVGALAQAGLLLAQPKASVRYALPPVLTSGIAEVWRTCLVTGLELPLSVSDEVWFRRYSGVKLMVTPSQLGVRGPRSALSAVAWDVLGRACGDGDEVFKQLIGLGFRLDVVGLMGELSVELARAVGTRWTLGAGLIAAASCERPWLNPRCLRWIARELAAARTATEFGAPPGVLIGAEELVAAFEFFPHLYATDAAPDFLDVVMASWILHEDYHGAQLGGANTVGGMIGTITALGFASGSWTASFERLASWAWMWTIDDADPLGLRLGWNGVPPSSLRRAFAAETGVEVLDWLSGCLLVLMPSWTNAGALSEPIFFSRIEDRLPPGPRCASIARLIDSELSISVTDLGSAVLDVCGGLSGYRGFGTTPQEERSPLYDRPVLKFEDGTGVVSSALAFADRAVALPRSAIERGGSIGNRRTVGGGFGRLFEVGVARLVGRLRERFNVLVGDEIDGLVKLDGKRGDIAISSATATVFLECGLQPFIADATIGDSAAIDEMLEHYADKLEQAIGTTASGAVWAGVPRLGSHSTGYFVVVDDPVAFNAVHCVRIRELRPGVPELFVVGVDDLTRLVDLSEQGVDLPGALIGWQTGGSRLPLDHHIAKFERLVRPSWKHMFGVLTSLAGRIVPDAA